MRAEKSVSALRLIALLLSLIVASIQPIAQDAPLPLPPAAEERANIWVVTLMPGANPDDVAARMGLINAGPVPGTPNTYAFRANVPVGRADAETSQSVNTGLTYSPEVVQLVQQTLQERVTRDLPADTLFPNQWHLNNTGQSGTAGNDANVVAAWALGYTGAGVVVSSVDDGLHHTNDDLAGNYLASASWDFVDNDSNPAHGSHGTSVAGVMAADDDGTCGVGAAYEAQVTGARIFSVGASTDSNEAQALSNGFTRPANSISFAPIDIFNSSWGPNDNGMTLEGPGPLTRNALEQGIATGRGGLGSIYVWAAGNGKPGDDDVNADGYANSRYTIAVAATTDGGYSSWYSEWGSPILVNAPSNGGMSGIITTSGPSGCTNSFGGTSSASPLAAGVIALMLDANPNLTWRDVQHILVQTAEQNDPGNPNWHTNGAGLPFNHYYGFGRVDAAAAVALAQTWATVDPETTLDSGVRVVNEKIPNGPSASTPGPFISRSFEVTEPISVESVDVILDLQHSRRGDLYIELVSPSGMTSVLMHGRPNDTASNYNNWRFNTVAHWDELALGTWTIRIRDLYSVNDPGQNSDTFKSWRLQIHGTMSNETRITSQPSSVEVLVNESVTVSVGAAGGEPISYQWYIGAPDDTSNPILGANDATYTPPPLTADLQLWVSVTGSENSVNSESTTLTVVGAAGMLADSALNDIGLNDWLFKGSEGKILCGKKYVSPSCAARIRNKVSKATKLIQVVDLGAYPWSFQTGDVLKLTGQYRAPAKAKTKAVLRIVFDEPREKVVLPLNLVGAGGVWQSFEISHVLARTDVYKLNVRFVDKTVATGVNVWIDDIQLSHERGAVDRVGMTRDSGGVLPPPAAPDDFRGSN